MAHPEIDLTDIRTGRTAKYEIVHKERRFDVSGPVTYQIVVPSTTTVWPVRRQLTVSTFPLASPAAWRDESSIISMEHPNLPRFEAHGAGMIDERRVYIVVYQDLIPVMPVALDCTTAMYKRQTVLRTWRLAFAKCVTAGLAALHSARVVHRNIRLGNVGTLATDNRLFVLHGYSPYRVTDEWEFRCYSREDVFRLGFLLAEVVLGTPADSLHLLHDGIAASVKPIRVSVFEGAGLEVPSNVLVSRRDSRSIRNEIAKCFLKEDQRPSAGQLARFFANVGEP